LAKKGFILNNANFKLGLTKSFACNYLPDEQERLLIAVDERLHNSESYSWLMAQGFRRSGDQIYRPHCEDCSACKSIRVMVKQYTPSKSQKRLLKRSAQYTLVQSNTPKDEYYLLYEQYINNIHQDGSMYPATKDQYLSFLTQNNITEQLFIETWDNDKLICVAVTDCLTDGLSAVYTFYHPDYRKSGLGMLSIINQIKLTAERDKKFLYLGYQIDQCQKMNYKDRFFPYQRLIQNSWEIVNK
jgi:arginine-tRNA-protein transferase